MVTFDFSSFLVRVEEMGLLEILSAANAECARAEHASSSVPGATRNREAGSIAYGTRVKQFMFYLQSGSYPAGVDSSDPRLYLPVVRRLVQKGQLPHAYLDVLSPPDL